MPKPRTKFLKWRTGRLLRVGREVIAIKIDHRILWRILLPVADNKGYVFLEPHHEEFLERVISTSKGLTENSWSNGKWADGGCLYGDRMIPLDFLATTDEVDKIAAFACTHYSQIEIHCYPITDRLRLYRRLRATRAGRR